MDTANQDELEDLLYSLNEDGVAPVVVGFDHHGTPFLAYGYSPTGDDWDVGVITDDPHSLEHDYNDVGRCSECGAFERRAPGDALTFPVTVLAATPQEATA